MEDDYNKVHQLDSKLSNPQKYLLFFNNISKTENFCCCSLEFGVTLIAWLRIFLSLSFISLSIEELPFTIIEIYTTVSYIIFLRGRYLRKLDNIYLANNMFSIVFYFELFNGFISILFLDELEDNLHISKSKRRKFYYEYISTVIIIFIIDALILWAFYSYYFFLENYIKQNNKDFVNESIRQDIYNTLDNNEDKNEYEMKDYNTINI
jgi:hypothetical protein